MSRKNPIKPALFVGEVQNPTAFVVCDKFGEMVGTDFHPTREAAEAELAARLRPVTLAGVLDMRD